SRPRQCVRYRIADARARPRRLCRNSEPTLSPSSGLSFAPHDVGPATRTADRIEGTALPCLPPRPFIGTGTSPESLNGSLCICNSQDAGEKEAERSECQRCPETLPPCPNSARPLIRYSRYAADHTASSLPLGSAK